MADSRHQGIVGWIESVIESNPDNPVVVRFRSKLRWNNVYRIVSYTKSSLWVIPIFAILLELILLRVLHVLDAWLGWPFSRWGLQGAETLLQTIITLNLSFMVFTFGSLLVAIQVASGQMTPRIIATALLRDNVVRYSVGLFVFTLLFAVSTQSRIGKTVHQLPLFFAGMLGLLSIANFLYLIDYASRLLRPVSILGRVGKMGLAVIDSVYPQMTKGQAPPTNRNLGLPEQTIPKRGTGEIIIALNIKALVAEAKAADCVIEFAPRIGDFIAAGEPLFRIYGNAAEINVLKLRTAVAYGSERTMEQDPTFSFRILVDIGLKALSPAINDPTTAVLATDQLHRLLRVVGQRHLHDDEVKDETGRLRLILRTPNWDDFVHLAFTEIRHCGAGHVQVARRLRAMIENLVSTLPEHRHSALHLQMDLLNRTLEQHYTFPEDLALTRIPDTQGL
jgi:uncharacterized membrane protein